MIPPQLAILAAKHGKKIAIGIGILIVIAGVYFAVKMHERTVEKLAESEAARAAQVVAHEVTIASLDVQKEATARWQASAEKYQETLNAQNQLREEAVESAQQLRSTLSTGRLERIARAKPALLERRVNAATARVIGLLNCSSTARGCDGDRGTPGPDAANSLSPAPSAGTLRVDGHGPRALARSRSSLLLPGPVRLRSSGT